MPPPKDIEDQENSERWLLTYADLITLLLAFFIVMYSMSQIDAKKFGKMRTQLSSILRGGATIFPEGRALDSDGSGMLKIGNLHMVQKRIRAKFNMAGDYRATESEGGPKFDATTAQAISSEIGERGLTIHIEDYALFESGKAALRNEAVAVLDAIAEEISGAENHICVEGHTDNLPIHTANFPSNWELSTARATNVVRYLTEKKSFDPTRVSARGFGEFRPIASNSTEAGKSRNRRVDIVILSETLSSVEPVPRDRVTESVKDLASGSTEDSIAVVAADADKLK